MLYTFGFWALLVVDVAVQAALTWIGFVNFSPSPLRAGGGEVRFADVGCPALLYAYMMWIESSSLRMAFLFFFFSPSPSSPSDMYNSIVYYFFTT